MDPRPSEELTQSQSGKDNCKSPDDPEYRDESRSDHSHSEESGDKPKHKRPCRNGLQDNDHLFFSFPQTSGPVQAVCGENQMPEIEKAEEQKEVRQFDAHGKECGEGSELGEMPSQNRRYHVGKGEHARVEQHEHLEQDLPAEVCHTRTSSRRIVVRSKP